MNFDNKINPKDKTSPTLPFSNQKQLAFLGFLFTDEQLFLRCKDLVQPTWFEDPLAARLLETSLALYKLVGRSPKIQEIKDHPYVRCEDFGRKVKLEIKIEQALAEMQNYGLDLMLLELEDWVRARICKEAVEKTAELYNKNELNQAWEIIKNSVQQERNLTFQAGDAISFQDIDGYFEENFQAYENACKFGLDVMDELMAPMQKQLGGHGGLLPGDTTLIVAPANIGKTSCLVTIACANIKACRSVFFSHHEGSKRDLQGKIWRCMLGVTEDELHQLHKTKAGRERMYEMLAFMNRYLTYVPLSKPGLTVEEVERTIRRHQEERRAKFGAGYNLIIDDYPGLLSTQEASKGNLQTRNIIEKSYRFFVAIGEEFNSHMVIAAQTNREGSKAVKESDRFLTFDDLHESFAPAQAVTNCITINRDLASEAKSVLTYFLCKSRSNRRNIAVVCKEALHRAIAHSNKLGATYYRASRPMTQIVDDILKQFNGEETPMSVIQNAQIN